MDSAQSISIIIGSGDPQATGPGGGPATGSDFSVPMAVPLYLEGSEGKRWEMCVRTLSCPAPTVVDRSIFVYLQNGVIEGSNVGSTYAQLLYRTLPVTSITTPYSEMQLSPLIPWKPVQPIDFLDRLDVELRDSTGAPLGAGFSVIEIIIRPVS